MIFTHIGKDDAVTILCSRYALRTSLYCVALLQCGEEHIPWPLKENKKKHHNMHMVGCNNTKQIMLFWDGMFETQKVRRCNKFRNEW